MTESTNDITVVTGRRACRSCEYVNESGNEYCFHCGAPMGSVPEIIGDPSLAAQNRLSWQVYGVQTAIVGRDRELELLTERFRKVVERDRLHAVLLSGAIGLGKSRLIDEFSRVVNTRFGNALLISGSWRDTSEGAYAIVDRLLRSRFYIPERLPQDEARERLLEGIRGIIKNPVALEIAHRIGALLDLPFPDSPFGANESPSEAREASWRALAKLIKTDAGANPMVLVLENFHYAGEESLQLIPFLARTLADTPILTIFSASAGFVEANPETFDQLPYLEQVELRPLADEDIRAIVEQVLYRADDIPEIVYRRVCDNSMGNPWIAEEILRILMAQGAISTNDSIWRVDADRVASLQLPRGASDVSQAVIELLTDEERDLLEQAATVGETFWLGALNVLAHNACEVPDTEFLWEETARGEDEILEDLELLSQKDVIRRRQESRYPNEVEYVFKHDSVRRKLLENIEPDRSSRLHRLIALWHEMNRAAGIREIDAVIAEHHENAHHPGRAAFFYITAARKAQEQYDNTRAITLYKRALTLLDDSRLLQQVQVLHDIGSVYDLTGEYATALPYLKELLRCSWRLASLGKGGAAHNKLGRVLRSLGRYDEAMTHFEHALNLFRRANDHVGIASTLDDIGKVHWIRGAYRAALEHYKEGLERRRELGDKRSLALSLNHLGGVLLHQGDFKEALRHLREALALRKEIGDRRGVADSLNGLGVILAERGALEDALRLWTESAEVAREIGDRMLEGVTKNNLGEIACQLGRLDEAEEYLNAADKICKEGAEQRLLVDVTRNRGLLELRRNETTRSLELMENALELARRINTRGLEGIVMRSLAEVHAHRLVGAGDGEQHLAEAEKAFQASIEILEEVGQEAELGRACLSYGTFLAEHSLFVRAKKRLEIAKEIFERIGMTALFAKADGLLKEL